MTTGHPTQEYLGDGVYAAWEGWRARLWTEDGTGPQNVLWLEPEVFACLTRFWNRMQDRGPRSEGPPEPETAAERVNTPPHGPKAP